MTIQESAQLYLDLKNRRIHPNGEFDKSGRWYPDARERCCCCESLRSPSRAYPYSLMLHCRTAVHIGKKSGFSPAEIKKEAKKLKGKITCC